MKRKLLAAILVTLIANGSLLAQKAQNLVNIASPVASGLGQYGVVPVSYFSGLPNISIPLYTIKNGPINIPISLSYHASGVRPDNHPGWVGVGWSLNAGGVISRVVNGAPDEIVQDGTHPGAADAHSYLTNYTSLQNSDWYANPNLTNIVSNFTVAANAANAVMPDPDEFVFNFLGYSGSFFLDHTGTWRVRSENNKTFKVAVTTTSNYQLFSDPTSSYSITLGKIIYKITITTADGVIFTFGGSPTTLEFTRPSGNDGDATNHVVVPSSWYLDQIQYPNGDNVYLTYEQAPPVITVSDTWNVSSSSQTTSVTNSQSSNGSGGNSFTLINPVYLKQIQTPDCVVNFNKVPSTELGYGSAFLSYVTGGYPDLQPITNESTWYQLNSIQVNGDIKSEEFQFEYSADLNSRLFLQRMKQISNDGSSALKYNFTYDATPLPPYNSRKLDHWGYYNNNSYWSNVTSNHVFSEADLQAYTASRAPDLSGQYMKAGVLTAIQYPTGGKVQFEYEPHRYKKVVQNDLTTGITVGVNTMEQIAGGLRIKRITDAYTNGSIVVRNFAYNSSADGSCSGVLGGIPQYYEHITASNNTDIVHFYNYSAEPLSNTSGNHVTYSEVQEIFSDGSKKNYAYTNQDATSSSYLDQFMPAGYNKIHNLPIDMSAQRGLLLKETTFDQGNAVRQNIDYSYSTDASLFSDNVRAVKIDNNPYLISAYPYLRYLETPYLIQKVQTDYSSVSTNPTTVTTTKYFHDNPNHQFLTRTELTNSDGTTTTSLTTYPQDYASGTTFIDDMVSNNLLNYPIETVNYKFDGTTANILSGAFKQYRTGGTGLIDRVLKTEFVTPVTLSQFKFSNVAGGFLPFQTTPGTYGYDSHYKTDYVINQYDGRHNILTVTPDAGAPLSYLWDLSSNPVAEVKNASHNQFFYQGFEGYPSISGVSTTNPHSGAYAYWGSSYTVSWAIPDARSYVISYWYHSNGMWKYSGIIPYTNPITLTNGDGYDDIRIYPADAQMKTYTYKSLIGMTSSLDEKGLLASYEYDQFNRLMNVRDESGNIVKNYQYQANFIDHANTTASWINNNNNSCALDPNGFNTGEEFKEEIDNNPLSPTYNTTRKVSLGVTGNCPPPLPATYSLDYSVGSDYRYAYVTVTKDHADNIRAICRIKIEYDNDHSSDNTFTQDIQFEATDTVQNVTVDVGAASYITVTIQQIINN